jgi:pyrimidine-nucleoside phosphorylase
MEDTEFLAALMVATAEAAGTRTVALLTDMGQPLGRAAGNWIELAECVELLRGERPARSPDTNFDLRELSLILAGWMIHLGGKAESPKTGYTLAEAALDDGAALAAFMKMVDAQGGDVSVFDDMAKFHKPGATQELEAWESGFVVGMDTTALGWAVQRTGAGREKAGEPVDPHAGIVFHARRGAKVEKGQPFATIYATRPEMLAEPVAIIQRAVSFSRTPPDAIPLVGRVFTAANAEEHLKLAGRS